MITPDSVEVEVERGPAVGTWEVRFVAPALPGTLALFAGILTLHRLDILAATIRKLPDGTVHDAFEVHPMPGASVDSALAETLRAQATAALAGRLNVAAALRALRREFVAGSHDAPEIVFETASEITTGVRVRTPDRPGLLHDLASALTAHGLRTRSITVLTVGGVARDTFRVVDAAGQPPVSPELFDRLRPALERAATGY